jgi:hypothetical protein
MEPNSLRLLYGNGSDQTNAKVVQRRARCKLITQTTMLKLIDVTKDRGTKDRVKAYWNTYHCRNQIYTANYTHRNVKTGFVLIAVGYVRLN